MTGTIVDLGGLDFRHVHATPELAAIVAVGRERNAPSDEIWQLLHRENPTISLKTAMLLELALSNQRSIDLPPLREPWPTLRPLAPPVYLPALPGRAIATYEELDHRVVTTEVPLQEALDIAAMTAAGRRPRAIWDRVWQEQLNVENLQNVEIDEAMLLAHLLARFREPGPDAALDRQVDDFIAHVEHGTPHDPLPGLGFDTSERRHLIYCVGGGNWPMLQVMLDRIPVLQSVRHGFVQRLIETFRGDRLSADFDRKLYRPSDVGVTITADERLTAAAARGLGALRIAVDDHFMHTNATNHQRRWLTERYLRQAQE